METHNNYKIICNYPKVVDNSLIIQTQTSQRWLGKRGDVKRDIYNNQRVVQILVCTIKNWAKPQDTQLFQKFYQKIVLQDLSYARQHIYLIRLKQLSKLTDKPISQLTTIDVHKIIFILKQQQIPPATIKLYLETIRKFFKTALNKKPPIKDIKIHIPHHYPKQLLDEEDIYKLTKSALNYRDKALIQTLWETGARIGEILNMKVEDINFAQQTLRLDGKTGERIITIISSWKWLKQYTKLYALQSNDYVWKELNANKPLSWDNTRRQLQKIAKRAGITKPVNPHNFRHSRATHCAQTMTESLLKPYFGWSQTSDVPGTYVHLSGKDIRNSILIMNGFAPQKQKISILAPKQCPNCQELNTYEETTCTECHKKLISVKLLVN